MHMKKMEHIPKKSKKLLTENSGDKMKLIAGLGNIGKEYQNTRHNIGFYFIDYFAQKENASINKTKFNGEYIEIIKNDEKIILLKPGLYMNLSGIVIKKYIDYFKINPMDILIIHDDLDLQIGKFKLRPSGSSAGHNGLKNIEEQLATQNYKRLKIGISKNQNIDTKDYVLGTFTKQEKETIDELKDTIYNVIHDFLKYDFEELMSKYNRK
jgi:peptidyl-tRNA hydrolase